MTMRILPAWKFVMVFKKRLPGADNLVMELDLVIILDFLALPDVLRGDVEVGGAHVGLGKIGAAGMVEQRQGAAYAGPDSGGGDALLDVPGHSLLDVLAVVHCDLHHMIQQAAYVRLDVIEFSVTLA